MDEDNTLRRVNVNGFCVICGEPNFNPVKFFSIVICKECYITRTDDAYLIAKHLKVKMEDTKNGD